MAQLHPVACEYHISPAPLLENTVLSPLGKSQQACQKSFGHIWEGLFLVSLFYSIGQYAYLYTSTHCNWTDFIYISFS